VLGATSPFSLFDGGVAAYGETNALWSGRDAQGFARLYALQAYLAHRADSLSLATVTGDL
jgi:argininosuccinate synthase